MTLPYSNAQSGMAAREENVRLKYGVEWLRKVIHACNRNPIPNSQRMRWREICDDILEGKHVNPDDPNFTEGR